MPSTATRTTLRAVMAAMTEHCPSLTATHGEVSAWFAQCVHLLTPITSDPSHPEHDDACVLAAKYSADARGACQAGGDAMSDPFMLPLLLGSGVALALAVLLWKLLVLTGGIAVAQWAFVTGFADNPAVQAAAFALPALLAAAALLYLPRAAGRSAQARLHRARSSFNPRRRAHQTRWEAMA
ncbi:hypothetical protein ACVDFE_35910 [Lentzea chajnantorensis]